MKLHDAEIVQFQDENRAWQRGRVPRDSNGHAVFCRISGEAHWLIRHGLSNDLEYVPVIKLQVQPEEHPE